MAEWQPPLDLFGDDPATALVREPLNERCWVELDRGWVSRSDNQPAVDHFEALSSTLTFETASREMYDRVVNVPRLLCWCPLSDPDTPPIFVEWGARIDATYGTRMASAGVNFYRDGNDSVAWHGDLIGAGRQDSLVAIVSLGATRPLLVRHGTGGPSRKWELQHGDLFVMGGRSQHEFQHSIPKLARSGPRMSIVFRETRVEDEPEYDLPPAG